MTLWIAGKPPPIASARFAAPLDFPYDFTLRDPGDLTEEGAAEGGAWWAGADLTVSARLDTDGVAATRGPDDLVGRATFRRGGSKMAIDLQGRGFGGRLVTSKQK